MRIGFQLILTLLFYGCTFAQPNSTDTFTPGTWIFREYNSNIVQVTFRPDGYTHNENISDAVILKPAFDAKSKKVIAASDAGKIRMQNGEIRYEGSSLEISRNNSVVSIKFQSDKDYRGFDISMEKGERFFGGGERALPLDRRGYRFNLYNAPAYGYGEGAENLNYSVPVITSSRKYALFFDNVAKGYFDIGKKDAEVLQYGTFSGDLTFYLITGDDYREILTAYHRLTGTQPLPPRWALGTFMSRFGYTSENQTREIYNRMKQEGIPFDAVIFDLFWFGDSIKGTLGNLDWVNKQKWPDPAKMIAGFKADGVQTILITEPFILEGTRTFESFKPYLGVDSTGKLYTLDKFYFGKGGLIDLFQNDAQLHFWKYYKQQMDIGVEGWWGDLGEPENHPSDLYHKLTDFGYTRLFSADEVHNAYGHFWTRMLFNQFALQYPEKRLFSLNRSGFAGTQRYGIFPWSGDVSRSWSGLKAQLPVMLGMSMSGIPYVHADAGGFAGGSGDNELYVRWIQFAQFTPIFRPHGTGLYEVDSRAFSFPSEIALIDTPYRAIAKEAARQRYEMLPYNYTMSYLQTTEAAPLVSPLYFYYQSDSTVYHIEDQYMWGEEIMVAPVLEKGAGTRNVYLPPGNWYRWKSNVPLTGKAWLKEELSLNMIPVYVKAGSLVPLLPSGNTIMSTAQYSTKEITWHYYASDQVATGVLFDDDGFSKSSLTVGQYEVITATVTPENSTCHFEFSGSKGTFASAPAERTFRVVMHGMPSSAKLLPSKKLKIESSLSANNELILTFSYTGKKVSFSVAE
jgi:oligosaccharide 4-alpha-D-glucosyltransferase